MRTCKHASTPPRDELTRLPGEHACIHCITYARLHAVHLELSTKQLSTPNQANAYDNQCMKNNNLPTSDHPRNPATCPKFKPSAASASGAGALKQSQQHAKRSRPSLLGPSEVVGSKSKRRLHYCISTSEPVSFVNRHKFHSTQNTICPISHSLRRNARRQSSARLHMQEKPRLRPAACTAPSPNPANSCSCG